MHTDGHDLGKETVGANAPGTPHVEPGPGYETTDANVNGVAVFLAGLFGFVIVFFFVCFGLGKLINNGLAADYAKEYGGPNQWHGGPAAKAKREDLASNPEMQQKELQRMTASFPNPRLDIDDGNYATYELHAREDLLLDHFSSGPDGATRIPIAHAMELIAQRGLPVNAAAAPTTQLAGDMKPAVQAPLTTGFARTGYELDAIEAREQKMNFKKAEESTHAELVPAK